MCSFFFRRKTLSSDTQEEWAVVQCIRLLKLALFLKNNIIKGPLEVGIQDVEHCLLFDILYNPSKKSVHGLSSDCSSMCINYRLEIAVQY